MTFDRKWHFIFNQIEPAEYWPFLINLSLKVFTPLAFNFNQLGQSPDLNLMKNLRRKSLKHLREFVKGVSACRKRVWLL